VITCEFELLQRHDTLQRLRLALEDENIPTHENHVAGGF
jgi:hypothetical protein